MSYLLKKNKINSIVNISLFNLYTLLIFIFIFPFKVLSINPLAEDVNAINAGAELYKTRCSNCHGINAKGKENGFFLSPNLKIFDKGYNSFLNILVNGYGRMPAWGGTSRLTKEQLNQLAAFLKNIADKEANWN